MPIRFFYIAFFSIISIVYQPCLAGPVTQTPPWAIGIDANLPYTISVDQSNISERAPMTLGLDFRRFTNNHLNVGIRIEMDIEDMPGRPFALGLRPGVQYYWLQGGHWMPFARADFPFLVRGAFHPDGKKQQDFGLALGAGLAWNIGNQAGLPNVLLRYDFGAQYLFGFGEALATFSLDFLKIGVEYRF